MAVVQKQVWSLRVPHVPKHPSGLVNVSVHRHKIEPAVEIHIAKSASKAQAVSRACPIPAFIDASA